MSKWGKDVSFVLPALHGGGVERVFLELSRGMAQRGLSVELVVAGGDGVLTSQVDGRVTLIDLGVPPRLRLLRAYVPLSAHFARTRPRWVIPVWGYFDFVPLRAAWSAGASVLFVLHSTTDYFEDLPPLKRRFALWSAKRSLQALLKREGEGKGLVGGVSRGVLQDFAVRFGLPLQSKEVFPNPLDAERVLSLAQAPCPHPWAQKGRPFFAAVGRLHPHKGFDLLLQAFACFKAGDREGHGLLLLGEGPERGRLEGLAASLGLGEEVSLPGFFPNPYPCLRQAKALVMTSVYEGFAMVLLEALALGIPIIAAQAKGGVAEALGNGRFGLLVSRSPEAVADAMGRVASGQYPAPSRGDVDRHLDWHRLERVVEFYLSRMGF